MKAARRRNSGTGDDEKGWKRSSCLSFTVEGRESFPAAAASDFDPELVVNVLEVEVFGAVRFVLSDAIVPAGRIDSC